MTELTLSIDDKLADEILVKAKQTGLNVNEFLTNLIQRLIRTDEKLNLDNLPVRKARSLEKYYGTMDIEGDPLEIQKELRNEWGD